MISEFSWRVVQRSFALTPSLRCLRKSTGVELGGGGICPRLGEENYNKFTFIKVVQIL